MDGGFSGLGDVADAVGSPATASVVLWLLAGVFWVSGAGKLRAPATAARALADFGLTRRPSPRAGLMAGVVELATGAACAAGAVGIMATRAAALPAMLLLCAFTAMIAWSLRRGATFSCNCFGEGDAPLSRSTLVRTGLLAVLACLSVVSPAATDPVVAHPLTAAALAGCAALLVAGRRLRRLNDDPLGLRDTAWSERAYDLPPERR